MVGHLSAAWRATLVGVLWLCLAACVPTSEHPIAVPGSKPDQDIVGTWHGTLEDGGPVYLHILRRADDALGALMVSRGDTAEARDEWAAFRLITASVDGQRYMSVQWDYNDGTPVEGRDRGYHLVRYSLEPDGSLALYTVNEDRLIEAVKAGAVAGTIEENQWNEEVRLTASSEKLVAFLTQSDPFFLFDKPFTRLKLAKN